MQELILKKCSSCGALVKVINDCHCPCQIRCCDKEMITLKANSVDASMEKHVPTFAVVNNSLKVNVNHVMDEDHFIEWIMFVTEDKEETVYFKPGDIAEAIFPYKEGILYSYCNKHGLWSQEVYSKDE